MPQIANPQARSLGDPSRLDAAYPRGGLLARKQDGVGDSEPERLPALHAHKGDAHLVAVRVRVRVRVRAEVRRMRMRLAQPSPCPESR